MGEPTIVAPLQDLEARDSGSPNAAFTFKGHSPVFDTAYDLGCFTQRIARGAFVPALRNGSTSAFWTEGGDRGIGRTGHRPRTFAIGEDDTGLVLWARPHRTSYALDLRVL